MLKKSFKNHRDEGRGFSDTLARPTEAGSLCSDLALASATCGGLGTVAAHSPSLACSADSRLGPACPDGGFAAYASSPAGARRDSKAVLTRSSKPLPSSRLDFFSILLMKKMGNGI